MAWEVRITGDDADLRMLAQVFTGPGLAIKERGTEFCLSGTDFDQLGDVGAVRDKAREVISSVSGASRLFLGAKEPVEVDNVVRVDTEGRRHQTIFAEPAVLAIRALPVSLSVTRADGTVERHLPADPIVEASRKASESEAVRKVLRMRDRDELVWIDLTVIAEVIEAEGFKFTKRDKDDLGRLTGSANHPDVAGDLARHGAPKWDPPPEHKRMKLEEGREFIDRIIRDWLSSK